MLYQINESQVIEKIKPLFNDIRFYIGNSVLQGHIGKIYVDDKENPNLAILEARNYVLISGLVSNELLKKIVNMGDYR